MANIERRQERTHDHATLGVIILLVGLFLLMRRSHFFIIPHFVFSWPLILILIGLVLGLRDGFKNNRWWILMLIGGVFLMPHNFLFLGFGHFFFPAVLIAAGLLIVLNHKRKEEEKPQTNNFTEVQK
jgi:predicted membrane protein